MKLWFLLPESIRELLEAPYRREARIEVQEIVKRENEGILDFLDAGSGNCFAKKFLRNRKHTYSAIDLEPECAEAKRGDIQNLDFSNESFDLVICLEVLEYVPDPAKALREFFRVLRVGGKLVLTTPLLAAGYHSDLHRWSPPKLESFVQESGLHLKKLRPMGGYFRMLGWQISKISYRIKKPKNPLFWPLYYLIKIPIGLVFQILIPLFLFSLDFLDKDKRDTCGYVCVAEKS